jgi:hypothetical protein
MVILNHKKRAAKALFYFQLREYIYYRLLSELDSSLDELRLLLR